MDFTYKVEDIRLIYAFHAFACILVDKKLCTQRCTPKSGGAANFSFYPEVLRCRDHIKLEMNQIVCWVVPFFLRARSSTMKIEIRAGRLPVCHRPRGATIQPVVRSFASLTLGKGASKMLRATGNARMVRGATDI